MHFWRLTTRQNGLDQNSNGIGTACYHRLIKFQNEIWEIKVGLRHHLHYLATNLLHKRVTDLEVHLRTKNQSILSVNICKGYIILIIISDLSSFKNEKKNNFAGGNIFQHSRINHPGRVFPFSRKGEEFAVFGHFHPGRVYRIFDKYSPLNCFQLTHLRLGIYAGRNIQE